MQSLRKLGDGTIEVFEPIRLGGYDAKLVGEGGACRTKTTIRRGRLPDGSLYSGPLILVDDARGALIESMIIEGNRFSEKGGARFDERHPLTADRRSAYFPCSRKLEAPACFERNNFISHLDADVLIRNSTDVDIKDLTCREPVRIGVAIAEGCARVRIQDLVVRRAGDYGVWIGTGSEPTDPVLPLDPSFVARMPREIFLDRGLVERCGSAGIFIDGRKIEVSNFKLFANNFDCPYDDESGQLVIDYKTEDVKVIDSCILGGPETLRERPDGSTALLGTVGVEASGLGLCFENSIIEGNSREGVQLLGARQVRFTGHTRIGNNHLAQHRHPSISANPERQNVSITTLAPFAAVGAVADDISLEDTICENGIIVWTDNSVPGWQLKRLTIRNSDLSGPDHSGATAGLDWEGKSVRGSNWSIEEGDL